ncbi:hypothetical protein [Hyphomicrobium sp.]|uniref:hypothetical protein n=1 Tax=Hyphomicrobium sp. TaxID=82 RepID=UPI002C2A5534|nr:hypothetical protein [Hyphomicrobium sp.]HRQ25809.1 hypothetical protein [Hyphomicrobium sp.]
MLHIRRQVLTKDGVVERDEMLKLSVNSVSDAEREIERLQGIFPRHGYNEEKHYWWGRNEDSEFRINRWFIVGSDD